LTPDKIGMIRVPLSGIRPIGFQEGKQAMMRWHPRQVVLPLAALALAGLLGGCVVYPDYPAGRHPRPYSGGPYVGVGGGWHHHGW
jgi:hypothetical protein